MADYGKISDLSNFIELDDCGIGVYPVFECVSESFDYGKLLYWEIGCPSCSSVFKFGPIFETSSDAIKYFILHRFDHSYNEENGYCGLGDWYDEIQNM